jgi:hypothetical protein
MKTFPLLIIFLLQSIVCYHTADAQANVCFIVYQMAGTKRNVAIGVLFIRLSHCIIPSITAYPSLEKNGYVTDNNLEYFMREDNHELIQSPAIRKTSLTTWVYYDGRNVKSGFINDLFRNIRVPLEEDPCT